LDLSGALKVLSKEFIVEGRGETKEAALQAAFRNMRKKAFSEVKESIVYMEPEEILITKAEVSRYTERFLFLFWPRERTNYTITFRVKVLIKVVDFSGVPFEEVTATDPGSESHRLLRILLNPGRK